MNYFIIINIILSILICLIKADTECPVDKVCMDTEEDTEESCIQLFHQTSDHSYVEFCNKEKTKICCVPPYMPKTVSEKKCMEWHEIPNFCANIPLIAHGEPVEPHSLPFMALIKFTGPKTEPSVCGGVLIERQWVLTAGHCFDTMRNEPTAKLTVYLGAHNFTNSGIAFNGTYIVHEDYGNNDTLADLALIRLEREAEITDKVKPACLAKDISIKERYVAAGWGLNGTSLPDHLVKNNLIEESDFQKCRMDNHPLDPTKNLCLKPVPPFGDVCQGDSGSPVFVQYPGHSNCNYEVVALVSEGKECKNPEGSNTLHTRIDFYRRWIEEKVWPNETVD